MHPRVGTRLGRQRERPDQLEQELGKHSFIGSQLAAHHARVVAVHCDAAAVETPRELAGVENVGALGASIGPAPRVAALQPEILEVDFASHSMRVGRR